MGVRGYRITVAAFRADRCESRHTVLAAGCNVTASSRFEIDPADLPQVWIRSTAKPFQILPLLAHPAGAFLQEDPRDIAVCVSSHHGTAEHAARVEAILARCGLGREHLRCGVHRPYFLQSLPARAAEHGAAYDVLHNNCSGNHAAMLLWARALGASEGDYLRPDAAPQEVLHAVVRAAAATAGEIGIDNCGAPCYRLPLPNLARAYLCLADPQEAASWSLPPAPGRLSQASARVEALERLREAMAGHPRWVSGDGTEATRLAGLLPGDLVLKHGAEGVLCVASRRHRASLALKVLDGNARALFPALLPLLQDLGWCDLDREPALQELARPVLHGAPGHVVGALRVLAGHAAVAGDAPTPAV